MKDVIQIVLTAIINSLLFYTAYSLLFEYWWSKGTRVILLPDKTLSQCWTKQTIFQICDLCVINKTEIFENYNVK